MDTPRVTYLHAPEMPMLIAILFLVGTLLEMSGAAILASRSTRWHLVGEQLLVYGLSWSGIGVIGMCVNGLATAPVWPGLVGAALVATFPVMWWLQIVAMWPRLSLARSPDARP